MEKHTSLYIVLNKKPLNKYLGLLSLDEKGLKRVNSLRKLVGNSDI